MKTRTHPKYPTWLAAALLAVLGACDGGSAAGPPPERILITVTTPELTLLPGEVGRVVATVQGGSGTPEWTTSDPAIATVDAAGTVTAKAPGDATVTASYRGARGSATVRVKPRNVHRVATTPDAATLHFVGDSLRLSAAAYDATGGHVAASFAWSSSDAAVATVDGDGKVTARGTGLARIVATSGAKADSSMIQVIQVVAALAVSPAAQTLTVGQTAPLQAAASDSGGTAIPGVGVTWTSSSPAVASVDAGGTLRAVAPGSAALTASAQGVSASARVDVAAVPVATLAISPASFSLTVGQSSPATAIARDAAGNPLTGRAVAWSSSDPAVATVAAGVVTAVGAGSATITATVEGKTASAPVAVQRVPVATVSISPASFALAVGANAQATAIAKDAAGNVLTGRVVAWSSSNPAVATIAAGTVTAVAAGSATITATVEGKTATAPVTVQPTAVASVSISPASFALTVGQNAQAGAVAKDAAGNVLTGRVVTWSSSNPAVANVSPVGVVWALAPGTATITATVEGRSGSAPVTVQAVPIATLSISPASFALTVGQSATATAVAKDAAGNVLTGRAVAWSSSNPAVATVASGVVRAVAAGSATITATSEGRSATAPVTVTAPATGGGTGALAFQDGFESGALAPSVSGYGWRGIEGLKANGEGVVVSRDVARSGSSSLKFIFAGNADPCDDASAEQRFQFGEDLTEVWIEYYIYITSGQEGIGARFHHRSPTCAAQNDPNGISENNKFFAVWDVEYSAKHVGVISEFRRLPNGDSHHYLLYDVNPFTRSYETEWNPSITDAVRGKWTRIRWHIKLASTHEAADGVVEMWADD
ncbi:MAG TPA: Ig-like domain-containing protein, partial [Longimicrobium sp.]|nr:Ig-like domain-containing protein [Longimicrobium sp.]